MNSNTNFVQWGKIQTPSVTLTSTANLPYYFNPIEETIVNKLYVISRAQLNTVYQCVQGGHAVAQFMLDNKHTQEWNNEYLIYLNTYTLDSLMKELDDLAIPYSAFKEPDLGNIVTSIACYHDGSLFKNLSLIK